MTQSFSSDGIEFSEGQWHKALLRALISDSKKGRCVHKAHSALFVFSVFPDISRRKTPS